ncbi:MAG: histidine phosphatase family protein [Bacilli bacterium]|nr:histidine phosphatase family protein [Bacilli bacterium]
MTEVYLIRHSVRLKTNKIDEYNTNQDNLLKNEKIILNVDGEKRAEILSNESELQNIDVVYCSNLVRTIATAKYLCEKQNLNINIDDRFDERRVGIPNSNQYPDWFQRQYFDENYKTINGESQKEVRDRFNEAFNEVISKNKNKRIAIFTHGYAITFFLLKWCKLIDVTDEQVLTIEFNNRILFSKRLNAPEVFKLTLNDDLELTNIELIEFEDLPYMQGV